MSWFSDWGAAGWSEDVEAAVEQARAWVDTTAAARGWVAYWRDSLYAHIEAAAGEADDEATVFWATLYNRALQWAAGVEAGGVTLPDGMAKQITAFGAAAGAATSTASGRDAGTVETVVGGTIAQTAEDVAEAADPTRSWLPWAAGALVLAVLAGMRK